MTSIRLWAPNTQRVRLRSGPPSPQVRDASDAVAALTENVGADGAADVELVVVSDGWWELPEGAAGPAFGDDYGFLLDDSDQLRPDPRSLSQPYGVHGPSRRYDQTTFGWSDRSWTGRPLTGAVIYELHIGTFTAEATFDGAISRLDHLVDLGVTHVELLPVNSFNGVWNWGYDGVDWYAVQHTYGGPEALKRFVDAAHHRGLAVVLDVVYNHLGPSGNFLPDFGPYLKTGRNTWGDLVNLELEPVRRYIVDNALMWLRDFHVDALRLDAVHALVDLTPQHILAQLSREVDALSVTVRRPLSLIAESDLNDPIMITSLEAGGHGLQAQWDDDVHHALHALLTGERQGYYDDFGSLDCLAKVFTSAFFHDGTYSTFRERNHGKPVDRAATPGHRFVVCLQNHDQIGNRAVGDRLPEITTTSRLKIGILLLMSSPFTPMLWMGEEWAASTRWPFFTSHPEPELAKATGEGRLAEFSSHGWDTTQMIDPQDPEAYRTAILDWAEPARGEHAEMLDFYRQIIALRRDEADLSDPRLDAVVVDIDEQRQTVVIHRGRLRVLVNLGPQAERFDVAGELLLATTDVSADLELPADSAAIIRLSPVV